MWESAAPTEDDVVDRLTITVIAVQQPRRAIKRIPEAHRYWCALCLASHDDLIARLEQAVLVTRRDGYDDVCCRCESPLEYTDLNPV